MPRIHAGTWSTAPVAPKTEKPAAPKHERVNKPSTGVTTQPTPEPAKVEEERKTQSGEKRISLFDTISLYD